VLRPAKPVPAGKSVKCPKCGAGFVIGQDGRAKSPAGKAKPAAPAKKPSRHDDDDDDGGTGETYSVASVEESQGPDIQYAPDLSVRDLRGPAMEEVVNPSNKMILAGVLGFMGWTIFLVMLLIPLLFPLSTKADRDKAREEKAKKDAMTKLNAPANAQAPEPKKDDDDSSILKIGDLDLRDIAELPWYLIVLCLLPQVLGMVYSATMSVGAVKIQNLESREWGVAASIMAMIPLNVGGLLCVLAMALNLLLGLVFEDDDGFRWVVMGFFLVCVWGLSLAVGIWNLTVLNKPDVVAGFEYVAE
jgi:MFS family permease